MKATYICSNCKEPLFGKEAKAAFCPHCDRLLEIEKFKPNVRK